MLSSRKADIYCGIAGITVAFAFYIQGRSLEYESNLFPLVLEAFLTLTGIYLLVSGFTRKHYKPMNPENIAYGRAFLIIGATIVYILGIMFIGFYVSSFAFLTVMSWLLSDRGRTPASLGISTFFGLILTGAVYVTFSLFLNVPTPSGILF